MQNKNILANNQIINLRVGTLVAVMVVSVSFLVGVGIGYEKIQARLRHLDAKTSLYQKQFDALEQRVSASDIKFAEIQKDLGSIQAIVLDIKNSLR